MEETPLTGQESQCCVSCGNPAYLKEYPTKLCSECRDKFIRFPVPKWLWLFAGAIGVIVVFSLFTFPKTLSLGVALEKGKKAVEQHRYVTAQKELEPVVEKLPGLIEARGQLMIAAFYNSDIITMNKMAQSIGTRNIEDQDLLAAMNAVLEKESHYNLDDSLLAITQRCDSLGIPVQDTVIIRFIHLFPDDVSAKFLYAGALLNENKYQASDSMCRLVFQTDAEYMPALALETTAQRQLGNYEESLKYCDRLLDMNKESSFGIASKSRTYLKIKKDKEALELALQACELNPKNGYAIGSLMLAYHFNNDIQKRDELINRYKNDSTMAHQLSYPLDVINKKEKFRD